ncbi:hypothetical protein GGX14DRAFT_401467 [Mycena pura]|uniref:Uncharacterized protein n=1 Tax=Mycena pura TaxID=153505 RepID=A0AAD6V0J9_9AGAR|nr:hypothetical protein GGX14DRAFT_401467 [Mycena pura]
MAPASVDVPVIRATRVRFAELANRGPQDRAEDSGGPICWDPLHGPDAPAAPKVRISQTASSARNTRKHTTSSRGRTRKTAANVALWTWSRERLVLHNVIDVGGSSEQEVASGKREVSAAHL